MTPTAEPAAERQGFIARYLAPVDSLSEVIFGLIMVLGWTTTAHLVFGATSARRLLLAVIGCNLAWALVDGIMYVLAVYYERSQHVKFVRSVRGATNAESAAEAAAERFDEDLEPVLSEAERAQVYVWIAARVSEEEPEPVRVTKEDILGAVASGVLVFVAVLPVAIPFLLISDSLVALRVSNLITVGLLFVVGYRWAHHTTLNPVVAGLLLLLVGLFLVAITVAFGG
jgi:VIT1/CCC1 family predicted Fe2+/Mn2+ transporter